MEKVRITVEYPLATKSEALVWGLIGNAHGLQKWMADYVEERNGEMTFRWGEAWTQQDVRKSTVIAEEENKFIRLKWDVNESDEDFWELRIDKSEFSGKLCLVITDHVDPDDVDYMKDLWNGDLDKLHAVSGL